MGTVLFPLNKRWSREGRSRFAERELKEENVFMPRFGNSVKQSYQSAFTSFCCSAFYGIMKNVNALFGMIDHCNAEAMAMHWRKRDLWKAGITLAGMLLLFVLMTWVPASAASVHEGVLGLATPGTITVRATPVEDATVAALNKEKLAQEVQQLKNLNEPDPFGWLRGNASILLSTLVVVFGGLFGLWRWRVDRRDAQDKGSKDRRDAQDKELEDRKAERERRAEERFQSIVEGLGSGREEAQVGATIMLRTFLRPGYEQFYTQTFDLAIAYLRLPRTPPSLEDPDAPLPLATLRQALIVVFKEAFPLARDERKRSLSPFNPRSLDASRIQLDSAYLAHTDLNNAWMREAFLRETSLAYVNLCKADLRKANLTRADLAQARLEGANFRKACLKGANLLMAHLEGADLSATNLCGANLRGADLSRINLSPGGSRGGIDLTPADLSGANPEDAQTLEGTDLRGVIGLTKEQLEACKAKGAIIDEDSRVSLSQSPVSPPPPSQSDDVQAQLTPSAQGNPPPPDTDVSSC
jgi:uncharacterized protein YjbI with pentapeptide repeats